MRTRLYRTTRGSNGYKKQERILGLKYRSFRDVTLLLFFILIVCVVGREFAELQPVEIISPLPLRAYAMTSSAPYKEPEPATLSEQEANIQIIKKIWGRDWKTGVAIAKCESGLRSDAFNGHNTNGTFDAGLFQINQVHGWTKAQLLDPVANTGIAYAKFVEQGVAPWYSSAKCWRGEVK